MFGSYDSRKTLLTTSNKEGPDMSSHGSEWIIVLVSRECPLENLGGNLYIHCLLLSNKHKNAFQYRKLLCGARKARKTPKQGARWRISPTNKISKSFLNLKMETASFSFHHRLSVGCNCFCAVKEIRMRCGLNLSSVASSRAVTVITLI